MLQSLPSSALAAADALHAASGRSKAAQIVAAAALIQPHLARGRPVTAETLRSSMETAFGGSDAEGAWLWRDAYEACEVAQVLFLRRYGAAMRRQSTSPAATLAMLDRVATLLPTQTKRSEESQRFQQFSTPIGLGYVAAFAAGIVDGDVVLEPSAGTGLLAIHVAGYATLALNELAPDRADLLDRLFPSQTVTRHDAAQIDDRLPAAVHPTVLLMNPPFSVAAGVEGRVRDAAFQHIRSAFARLADGGRLVAVIGSGLDPHAAAWREPFTRLQEHGHIVFSAPIAGQVYSRHGTTIETRLTVIDKVPADNATIFPPCPGLAPDAKTLLAWLFDRLPPRRPVAAVLGLPGKVASRPGLRSVRRTSPLPSPTPILEQPAVELVYETVDWMAGDRGSLSEAIYEGYTLQSVRMPTANPHPTLLVQSAAMASVAPPKPQYRPKLPASVIADGLLSDAQIESVIYAGDAHAGQLDGSWLIDATYDVASAAREDANDAVRFRRGWFLGDGTGAGKGRQVAGILLDNWLHGRRRAVWVSKSDKLLEDAQRDWSALGQERLLVTPQSRFRQGTPISLDVGILFTTYATIRSQEREGKVSRVQQLVDWLGRDFDGVIVFDEAHAMANAGGGKGERGDQAASQQGKAGLRLQHALPDARILYVSATGATTVENLAYAQRLGLWGGADFPFATRAEFVAAIEEGGVAAMEVLARDLKALGLYAARSLSYEGVEYELVEHKLTEDQTRIYDAYAGAFQVIHNNLRAAMEASNIRSAKGTLNGQAMSAALSAFESSKQRFFGHLITAMKTPTLIAAIDRDLAAGHAAVIQIVSTGEALLERRLADIPTEEWTDIRVDVTPREYVLDYLQHSFPVQLFEPFTDDSGNLSSRPVFDEGQPVLCREAIARRDRMIEHLAGLDPVQSALDQIVHRFGTDVVAEVTGRSRRIVRRPGRDGFDRLVVENRPGSANLAETQAFMDDTKRILVFSDAGGTGRSYHADLSARNQRLRVHYLLEAGWKADAAIQGLGRTNRTNQAQPPLFRPVATDVKAEKRFLSTIARRLDTLGAITKGQRQTGGQGLFRADDNLESVYAKAALRQFFVQLYAGRIEGCSLQDFEQATGLSLTDGDGSIREDLPAITTFLNRLLALTIAMQNRLFAAFEAILVSRIEGAVASGHYDAGVETLRADSLTILDRRTVHVHAASGAETRVFTIARRDRTHPLSLDEALERATEHGAKLLLNARSGRAAVQVPASSIMLDDGRIERRVRLLRPIERTAIGLDALAQTQWEETDREGFATAWVSEVSEVPAFTTSTFHVVTGLLLPIWKRIPDETCKVYRLQTDDGERIIGRLISDAALSALHRNLGLSGGPSLKPAAAWAIVSEGRASVQLADGLQVRRVRVMGEHRIELVGFSQGMRERLRADGLFSEIIAWTLRFFIPVGDAGPAIFARLVERHPLVGTIDRSAA
ncbi:strawberry notch family protein [Lichenihabitans psoromatis]|uniref:strawberry notch family protein n=1 Tax=Lichenihabitans psoromatis TaxID=2528642 RepID=UPI0010383324|nr:strawberry notch family protein [Lichenihabitans psoromatis]